MANWLDSLLNSSTPGVDTSLSFSSPSSFQDPTQSWGSILGSNWWDSTPSYDYSSSGASYPSTGTNWWDTYVNTPYPGVDTNLNLSPLPSFQDTSQSWNTTPTSNWWDSFPSYDPNLSLSGYSPLTDYPAAGNGSSSGILSGLRNLFGGSSGSGASSGGASSGGGSWGSLLAPLAGGLLGGINGSKQTGTETKTAAPWGPQQPYLLDMFNKAQAAANSGAMSPYETSALQGMQGFASGPKTNPYAGVDNPYLTQAINNASQDAMRNLMPAFDQAQNASGSFGNSGLAESFARNAASTLGNIATNARMQDYGTQQQLGENSVNRTMGALGPLFSSGNASAANPWTNVKNYANAVTGTFGGSSSSPIYTNPVSNILGGGLLGSQIYNNLMKPGGN